MFDKNENRVILNDLSFSAEEEYREFYEAYQGIDGYREPLISLEEWLYFCEAFKLLKKTYKNISVSADISIENMIPSITLSGTTLDFKNTDALLQVAEKSSICEIEPKLDGTVELTLTL